MKRYLFILWISLVVYTTMYLFVFQPNSTLIMEMINQTADPFALSFFNVMGVIPFLFIIDGFSHGKQPWYTSLFFLLSLAGGAYLLIPGYLTFTSVPKVYRRFSYVSLLLGLIGLLLIFSAFLTGQPGAFFSEWTNDAMVGIMSVDFLILYAVMILRGFELNKKQGWLSLIPVFGFSYLLFRSLNQVAKAQ
jgi:hypothetical protein